MKIPIKTDCCEKDYQLTPKQHCDLEKAGFLIYCSECAEKLNLSKRKAIEGGIKIYKV